MTNIQQQLRTVLAGLSLMLSGLSTPAHAAQADYPARPIRLIVPFSPGGGSDVIARILAPKLTDSMGQTWVVDNRPAAGGNIGMEMVATAQPDGYTVLQGVNAPLTVNPTLYPKLPFSVMRDLQPITKLTSAMHIVVVHPSVQASTLTEFIALARREPGKLNYASAGAGSTIHMAAEMFKYKIGVDLVHVPYKGGGPASLAVLTGEVQVLFGSLASTLSYVKSGKLKAFAVTGAKRSSAAPNIPTVAESGYPGFEVATWFALLVPAKTPRPIVMRLYEEALRVVKQLDIKEALGRQGMEVETSTRPEELAALMKTETAAWAKVIKAASIKLD
ncbi:MAG: tripartite tricarboxylate transporter substrate binding protein [Betaproteobacteria bacterium]|nr:tripartite tricarboxylate transporter substrate binding protein [Betaproteobacteria bacterium]